MSRQTGATRDYRNGRKNNWRRTIWNDVLHRTAGREKNELILYLAGPQDNDRAIAVSKGVPDKNLIAIDETKRNVVRLRGLGHSAVCADAIDTLWSWPHNRPVCAVLLDFCAGLVESTAGFYDAFQNPALNNAVVMVNFMRGRDAWSNPMRQAMRDAELFAPLAAGEAAGESLRGVSGPEHRAFEALLFNCYDWLCWGNATLDGQPCIPRPETDNQRIALVWVVWGLMGQHDPSFYSYRSIGRRGAVLVFDSAVFWTNWRRIGKEITEKERAGLMTMFPSRYPTEAALDAVLVRDRSALERRLREYSERPIVHKLGAMFAVRTRRERNAVDVTTTPSR